MTISKALGSDPILKSFDSIRHVIKTSKHLGIKASYAQIHEHELLKISLVQD